jgi:hypothetical protein
MALMRCFGANDCMSFVNVAELSDKLELHNF